VVEQQRQISHLISLNQLYLPMISQMVMLQDQEKHSHMPQPFPNPKTMTDSEWNLPCSVWDLSKLVLIGCNDAFKQMLGYTIEELQNSFHCSDLVPQRLAPTTLALCHNLNSNIVGKPVQLKTMFKHKNGTEVSVLTHIFVDVKLHHAIMKHREDKEEVLTFFPVH